MFVDKIESDFFSFLDAVSFTCKVTLMLMQWMELQRRVISSESIHFNWASGYKLKSEIRYEFQCLRVCQFTASGNAYNHRVRRLSLPAKLLNGDGPNWSLCRIKKPLEGSGPIGCGHPPSKSDRTQRHCFRRPSHTLIAPG